MIEQFVKGRVYVFIDCSNIYHSFKKLAWKIDFLKLLNYFKRHTEFGKIYFYTAYDPTDSDQRRFLDFLEIGRQQNLPLANQGEVLFCPAVAGQYKL